MSNNQKQKLVALGKKTVKQYAKERNTEEKSMKLFTESVWLVLVGITIIIAGLAMSGCGNLNKMAAGFTGYQETCVDGVAYLQFPSGATAKYSIDGRLVACK